MSKKNKTINTTGQLRKFMADLMIDIEAGTVDLDKARNITKLASQINESFYAEAKVNLTRQEIAGYVPPTLGNMNIGE